MAKELERLVDDDPAALDELKLADRFEVSPSVIAHQLQNHGLG